jgi:hypothetical protein
MQTRQIGGWQDLVDRLDADRRLDSWARREPVFAEMTSVGTLPHLTARSTHEADLVLGGLTRLAAIDGGDPDAALVVIHLLWPGVLRIAESLAPDPDRLDCVLSEIAIQIAAFPRKNRRVRVAANLLLDTRRAVCGTTSVRRDHRWSPRPEVPTDPASLGWATSWLSPAAQDDLDLADFIQWAERNQVVARRDLEVLIGLEFARDDADNPRAVVADAFGVCERTVDRCRDRALRRLRESAPRYLAAVA